MHLWLGIHVLSPVVCVAINNDECAISDYKVFELLNQRQWISNKAQDISS